VWELFSSDEAQALKIVCRQLVVPVPASEIRRFLISKGVRTFDGPHSSCFKLMGATNKVVGAYVRIFHELT
jgi:hypothetical protein